MVLRGRKGLQVLQVLQPIGAGLGLQLGRKTLDLSGKGAPGREILLLREIGQIGRAHV